MASKETFKKLQSQLNKRIPTKIKSQLEETLGDLSEISGAKIANRLNEQAQEAVQKATRTAQAKAQAASEVAKQSLDQVLLNLEHRGLNIKESQDLAIKVGKKVLERAEAIRAQLAENPLSPAWLKEVRLKTAGEEASTEAKDVASGSETTAVSTEIPSTVSAAASGVAEPSHAGSSDRVKATTARKTNDSSLA